MSSLPPGYKLNEFVLERVLGAGGFGIVYLATDTELNRKVAIKEYMPGSLANRDEGSQVVARSGRDEDDFRVGLRSFKKEALALASFDHPSLVKVYRYWEANGTAYTVMPFYEGVTLKQKVQEMDAPPTEAWLRAILLPISEALDVLHRGGWLHRDVAPDNILLLESGAPMLLDFGAARQVLSEKSAAATVILKPGYAPIEQYGQFPEFEQGPWTDVHALAAVMAWAMTGKKPQAAIARVLSPPGTRVLDEVAHLYSANFIGALEHALEARPNDRTPDMAALRRELAEGVRAAPRSGAAMASDDDDATVMPPGQAQRHARPAAFESPWPPSELPDSDATVRVDPAPGDRHTPPKGAASASRPDFGPPASGPDIAASALQPDIAAPASRPDIAASASRRDTASLWVDPGGSPAPASRPPVEPAAFSKPAASSGSHDFRGAPPQAPPPRSPWVMPAIAGAVVVLVLLGAGAWWLVEGSVPPPRSAAAAPGAARAGTTETPGAASPGAASTGAASTGAASPGAASPGAASPGAGPTAVAVAPTGPAVAQPAAPSPSPAAAAVTPTLDPVASASGGEFGKVVAQQDPSFGVAVSLVKTPLRIGRDELRIRLRAEREGFYYVLSHEPDGKLLVLWPNQTEPNNRIRAGETVNLPKSLHLLAAEPAGNGTIFVMVAPERIDFKALQPRKAGVFLMLPAGAQAAQLTPRDASGAARAFGAAAAPFQVE